jgi:hypothetical protein
MKLQIIKEDQVGINRLNIRTLYYLSSLLDRKIRSILTILMVTVESALLIVINGICAGFSASFQ